MLLLRAWLICAVDCPGGRIALLFVKTLLVIEVNGIAELDAFVGTKPLSSVDKKAMDTAPELPLYWSLPTFVVQLSKTQLSI